ncbi:hypothetical protein ACQPTN_05800 [Bradyrhizobium sp. 13971]
MAHDLPLEFYSNFRCLRYAQMTLIPLRLLLGARCRIAQPMAAPLAEQLNARKFSTWECPVDARVSGDSARCVDRDREQSGRMFFACSSIGTLIYSQQNTLFRIEKMPI